MGIRNLTEHESHLLGQWLKPGGNVPLGLAKRAWCVLQRDLPLEDLSACGLTEERILALFDNFDRMGIVGLADAPRSGRPVRHSVDLATVRSSRIASLDERDAVWRQSRLKGVALKRERNQLIGIAQISTPRLVGLYLSSQMQMAAWSAAVPAMLIARWYHPGVQARSALKVSSDWLLTTALKAHFQHPASARPRGEQDKLVFWMDATAQLCRTIPVGVTITTARQGVDWATLLKNMRRFGVWQGPGGLLESLQWQDREQWKQAVADALGRKQVPAAGHDQAAFACVAIRASRGVS